MTQEKWFIAYEDTDYIVEQLAVTNHEGMPDSLRYTNKSVKDSGWWKDLPSGFYFEDGKVFSPKSSGINQSIDTTPFIDTNPKTAFGTVKPGSFQTPPMPYYEYSLAHYQGSLKYGHYNWREDPVSISTYIEAARRHIDLYCEGQKEASDTGIHNLAHAMTCLSIVIDAEWYGTLLDDRSTFGSAEKMEEYFESRKPIRQRIAKDWTGHTQKLKDKLTAKKVVKSGFQLDLDFG